MTNSFFGPYPDQRRPLPPETGPGLGRIVHFHLPAPDGIETVAALITKVADDGTSVHLAVFQPDHLPGHTRGPIPFATEPTVGHWSWPPRT